MTFSIAEIERKSTLLSLTVGLVELEYFYFVGRAGDAQDVFVNFSKLVGSPVVLVHARFQRSAERQHKLFV